MFIIMKPAAQQYKAALLEEEEEEMLSGETKTQYKQTDERSCK